MQGPASPRGPLSLVLGSIAAANVILAIAFQAVILRALGAGAAADVLVAAQATPMVLYAVVGASLVSVWQPMFAVAAAEQRRSLASQALGQILGALTALSALLALLSSVWTPLLLPGFKGPVLRDAVEIGQVLLITLAPAGAASVLVAYARADDRFVLGEAVPAVVSAVALGALPATIGHAGLHGVAWLIVARSALILVVLWFAVRRPPPRFAADPAKREVWKSARPILAGSALYKLSPLVDRYLASLGGAGGMALFNLVQTGGAALSGVIDRAFGTPVAPALARRWAAGRHQEFRAAYRRVALLILGCTGGLAVALALMWPIWPILVESLLHLPAPQSRLLYALCFGLLGMVGAAACGSTLVAAFYAAGDTRTPMIIGVAGFLISLVLKYALFTEMRLPGLAWATSIYYGANLLIMWVMLERKIGRHAARRS